MLVELQIKDFSFSPSILSEERACDLCAKKKDIIDLIQCPSGNGYYCTCCLNNGDVVSYLKRQLKYQPEQITNFLNSI